MCELRTGYPGGGKTSSKRIKRRVCRKAQRERERERAWLFSKAMMIK